MRFAAIKWDDKVVAELKRLWCDEGVSASLIAQSLMDKFGGHVTRNSVIGKANRLGLEHPHTRPGTRKPAGRPSHDGHFKKSPPSIPPSKFLTRAFTKEPDATTPADPSTRIRLSDLRETTCRFPIGDPTTDKFRFCGGPSPIGKPYCAHHAAIAYIPSSKPMRRKNGDHHGMRVVRLAAN